MNGYKGWRNFRELVKHEVRRKPLPRGRVHRGTFGRLLYGLRLRRTVHQSRVYLADPRDMAQPLDQGEQLLFLAALA
jgi:hypothetical protein